MLHALPVERMCGEVACNNDQTVVDNTDLSVSVTHAYAWTWLYKLSLLVAC